MVGGHAGRHQRAHFGRKRQHAAGVVVVERLDAEAIARQEARALALVPDREGEHAAQPLDERRPFGFIQAQDHFGVAVRSKRRRRTVSNDARSSAKL